MTTAQLTRKQETMICKANKLGLNASPARQRVGGEMWVGIIITLPNGETRTCWNSRDIDDAMLECQ